MERVSSCLPRHMSSESWSRAVVTVEHGYFAENVLVGYVEEFRESRMLSSLDGSAAWAWG